MRISLQVLEELDLDVVLGGLPPAGSWRGLVDVGGIAFGLSGVDNAVRIVPVSGINDRWDFEFLLSEEDWSAFCAEPVARGYTTAQAVVATTNGRPVRGDRAVWARVAPVVDRVLDAVRAAVRTPSVRRPEPPEPPLGVSPITGRYLTVEVQGRRQRIYYETAGAGPALVCLHTAGADSRQFRYLLEDPAVTERWTVVAFDMPWHGRSEPPTGWQHEPYRLTTQVYADTVLAVIDGLGLRRPVLAGCSMGGAIALYLASTAGERFTGVCALEGGLGNPSRFVEWTNRSDVDHSLFLTSWVGGLIAPTSPAGPAAQTLWGYAQSGPGVYQGDTYFYSHDLPEHAESLRPATCPLYVFSGEYDYSATTEMSKDAAERLGGQLVEMSGKGHFPMSEDPASFAEYLLPVLDLLRDKYED
ncbi:alpha/beta hydrolase [Amycolatopsis sp. K13G38]|uniref:Alpha/beta hydrolase n=1 Tax=Amycolatopsis acididurans TaxID=2724524 RepID=A0ABX1J6S4_9PSEU|nr:alpha/beta hydrolase [Amycolatopsis acididurans]NKQ55491.1 alpha/beta hydrolase [Amycolatopsis acididurans]